jgi:hypothetical protein
VTTPATTLADVFLEDVDGDSLSLIMNGKRSSISIASIVQMGQTRPSQFWKGAGIGTLSGFVVGGIIGGSSSTATSSESYGAGAEFVVGGLIGGLAGFTIGGVVGSAVSADIVYNLVGMSSAQRKAVVQSIMTSE